MDHETLSQPGSITSERGIDIGRVGSWAMDFEKLLNDPVGLRTFAVKYFFVLVNSFFLNMQQFLTGIFEERIQP